MNKSVMIFIIRTLPHVRKKGEAKEAKQKKRKEKNERKERRGNVTILFPHLCFKVAP